MKQWTYCYNKYPKYLPKSRICWKNEFGYWRNSQNGCEIYSRRNYRMNYWRNHLTHRNVLSQTILDTSSKEIPKEFVNKSPKKKIRKISERINNGKINYRINFQGNPRKNNFKQFIKHFFYQIVEGIPRNSQKNVEEIPPKHHSNNKIFARLEWTSKELNRITAFPSIQKISQIFYCSGDERFSSACNGLRSTATATRSFQTIYKEIHRRVFQHVCGWN